MGVFSILRQNKPLLEILSELRSYGHPCLWYLVLYLAFKVIHASVALKIAHIIIAVFAIYIFLSKAPFDWPQKIFFILGYFPIYEYSVINRNYGIGMLFLFLLCSIYHQRFKNNAKYGAVIALLANTSAHALIIASAVTISWISEYFIGAIPLKKDPKKMAIGSMIAIIGITLSLAYIWPDRTSRPTNIYNLDPRLILTALTEITIKTIAYPGALFPILFSFLKSEYSFLLGTCVVWFIYIRLFRKPFIMLFFILSIIGLNLFFSLIYPASARHEGFLYLLIIMILWINADDRSENKSSLKYRLSYFLFILLTASQIILASYWVKLDLEEDFSSSKRFGDFIAKHTELKNAIILSEPDYYAEALPYYVDNPIYIPRENKFGKSTKFTTRNRTALSLGELLNTGKKLRSAYHRPVLFLIGYPFLNPNGPFEISVPFKRKFTYSSDSFFLFLKHTKIIASFHEAYRNDKDENYDIFLLR